MQKFVVGKNDKSTNFRLKWYTVPKEDWCYAMWIDSAISPQSSKALEQAFHFNTKEEARQVAKVVDGFVAAINQTWSWSHTVW